MFAYFVLGIALLIGFILLSKWFVTADTKSVAKAIKIVAVVLAVLLLIYLLISGRWALLPAVLFGALPWINRLRGLAQAFGGFGQVGGLGRGRPSPGKGSELETRFLRMYLDHDSGEMDGEVVEGRFAGRNLSEMAFGEQLELLRECFTEDSQSARVLEAYLDRIHGADWRERARAGDGGPGAGPGHMTRAEAYEILGLEPGASADEIKAAYHRLIGRLHPDQGGSTYLAAKLNEAKDVLLGG
ncbi:MAG: DnaJ domain-containing protein [Alphaproteobacteria bacterium]|nr:DnaJ domain-containing protein [Alphaproteobacteria bacterium]